MAVDTMALVRASLNDETNELGWEYSETLASPGNGKSVLLPNGCNGLSLTLSVTAGSGKIQTTTDLLENIHSGTAVWVDWLVGTVTVTTQDYCKPVSAIRQVNVSGTTKLMLRAQ